MAKLKAQNVFILLVSLCIMTVMSATAHAQVDSLFTVQDVKVDVTSENAAKAREEAFGKAQMKAFEILVERLASSGEAANITPPDYITVSSLVRDFEITNEQLSSVRYIGTYTFRFKKEAVRQYVGGQGISYSDVSSKPVLVLPFYQYGANTILWDDRNPWLKAWQSKRTNTGLVPVITPIGDVQDVSDIGDNEAMTFNADDLENMVIRYNVGEAIIMVAVPEWSGSNETGRDPEPLIVNLYRTDRGRPDFARRITVLPSDINGDQTIFDAAVAQSRKVLQEAWKKQTAASAENATVLTAIVRFTSMQEWLQTRKALNRVQGIDKVDVKSITPSTATVELAYQGSTRRLQISLAQADIDLKAPQQPDYNYGYADFDTSQSLQPMYELKLKLYQ